MFGRSVALALYLLFIGGLLLAIVFVSARFEVLATAALTFETQSAPPSRVTIGLEAQGRAARWQPVGYVLEQAPMPCLSVTELAKGMDAAEDQTLASEAKSEASPFGPRVAGWMRRVERKTAVSDAGESPGYLIVRSLRNELN